MDRKETALYGKIRGFAEKEKIDATIVDLSKEYAASFVRNLLDPSNPPIEGFSKVPLDTEEERVKYSLILDFLQASGLEIPQQILQYESQHPDFRYNRSEICRQLGLNSDSKDPMLVQIVRERVGFIRKAPK